MPVVALSLAVALLCSQQRGATPSVTEEAGQAWYRTSHALVIGVNHYEAGFRELNYAVADARAVGNILKERYGFASENVRELLDGEASLTNIRRELARLSNPGRVKADDLVVVYFAGHGHTIKLPDGGEMGFLIPYGAKVESSDFENPEPFNEFALSMEDLWRNLRAVSARHVMVIADACFSGLLAQPRSGDAPTQKTIDELLRLRARAIMTAGAANQTSQESPELGHGLFTYKLLENLRARAETAPGRVFLSQAIASELKVAVSNASGNGQIPQYKTDGQGEVLFKPGGTPRRGEEPTVPSGAASIESKVVSDLVLSGIAVADALKGLAEKGGFRVKLDPEVTGKVSVAYSKISIRNALNAILDQVDANWAFSGDECSVKPNSRKDELISVSICADSGLLATQYCPETIQRKYGKGRAPTQRCESHSSGTSGGKDPIIATLELQDAAVRDALKVAFQVAKVSYTIDPEVQGTVNVSLHNQPLSVVLRNILNQVNATYRVDGDVYVIFPKAPGEVVIPSLDFAGAEVRDALRIVFKTAKVSYSIDTDVFGQVTLSRTNIKFEEALRLILNQVDSTWILEGGVYRVVRKQYFSYPGGEVSRDQ